MLPLCLLWPWFDASFLPKLLGGGSIKQLFTVINEESESLIQNHKCTRHKQSEDNHFIDEFLSEMDNYQDDDKSPLGPIDGGKNLAGALSDFISAGTDTTCNNKQNHSELFNSFPISGMFVLGSFLHNGFRIVVTQFTSLKIF